MANINRVVLVGNLTRDPELRQTPSGTAVCSLRIAVNTRRKDSSPGSGPRSRTTSTSPSGASRARTARSTSPKGRPVAIDGRLEWREWDAQDGTKRQAVEVIADTVQFLGGRGRRRRRRRRGRQPVRARRRAERRRRRLPVRRRRHSVLRRRCLAAPKSERTSRPKRRSPDRGRPPQVVLLLQVEGRRDRLQERQRAPPLRLGAGQDPRPPDQRRVPPAPAPGRGRREARTRDRPAPVRRRPVGEPRGGDPQSRTSTRSACAARS